MKGQLDAEMLRRWRAADGHFDRPAEGLSERLGWLHQAIGALDEGKPEAVFALAAQARAAGQPDIALILELCATPIAELDPDICRGRATMEQRANRLPRFPDFVRALVLLRQGKRPKNLPKQSEASAVGSAAYMLVLSFASGARGFSTVPALTAQIPRATPAMLATWMFREKQLRRLISDPLFAELKLSPQRYPDLHKTVGLPGNLEARTRGTEPWNDGHDPVAQHLYGLPLPEQRAWLGAMLHRLARDTRAGRFHGLVGLCHAAVHVAMRFPELKPLAVQLAVLEQRLDWLEPTDLPEPFVLEQLWQEQHQLLSAADRLALAARVEKLLDVYDDGEHLISDDVADEVLACLIAGHAELRTLPGYIRSLSEMSRDVLENLLKRYGATETRRALTHALVASGRSELDNALLYLFKLRGAPSELRILLHDIHASAVRAPPSRGFRRNLSRVLGEPWSQPIARELAYIASFAQDVPLRFQEAVRQLMPKLSAEDPSEAIALAISVGASELAKEQIALLGRSLRKLTPERATERALAAIDRTLHVVAPLSLNHPVYTQLEPLTRFALRQGPEPVLSSIRRGSFAEDSPDGGLLYWILRDPTVFGDLPRVAQAIQLALSEDESPSPIESPHGIVLEIIIHAIKLGPCTPPELMQRVRLNVETATSAEGVRSLLATLSSTNEADFEGLLQGLFGLND